MPGVVADVQLSKNISHIQDTSESVSLQPQMMERSPFGEAQWTKRAIIVSSTSQMFGV